MSASTLSLINHRQCQLTFTSTSFLTPSCVSYSSSGLIMWLHTLSTYSIHPIPSCLSPKTHFPPWCRWFLMLPWEEWWAVPDQLQSQISGVPGKKGEKKSVAKAGLETWIMTTHLPNPLPCCYVIFSSSVYYWTTLAITQRIHSAVCWLCSPEVMDATLRETWSVIFFLLAPLVWNPRHANGFCGFTWWIK